MRVDVLAKPGPDCEAFVRSHPDARMCFLPAWSEMAERAFGHRTYYLAARSDQTWHGVLPLIHVRSRFFGNRLVSAALSDYGGPLAADDAARNALVDRAIALAQELGCDAMELRNLRPLPRDDLQSQTDKMTMHLSLPADPEILWRSLKAKVRNQVRKAEKAGLAAVSGGAELLGDLYEAYARRMHQLGTPAYSRRVLECLVETFPENHEVIVVRLDNACVGGGLALRLGGFVEMPFAAMHVEYNSLCPNNLLYWTVLKRSCEAGCKLFDFGRCTVDSNTHRFKKQWGPAPVPLGYQHWAPSGRELSIAGTSNPKYRWRIALWRRSPACLTRLAGPWLSRDLP